MSKQAGLLLLPFVLAMTACGSGEPVMDPVADRTFATGDVNRRLMQLFGPVHSQTDRDIFFGSTPRVAEVRKPGQPSLPLLVGIVSQRGVPAAFFIDSGRSHTYKEGDVIAGRYQIVKIAPSFVILQDTSARKAYRVTLTGS